jgi:hypothetical protein
VNKIEPLFKANLVTLSTTVTQTHTCIHDQLRHRVHRVDVDYGDERKRDGTGGVGGVVPGVTQVSPIRIFFDTRYINDERTCRAANQQSTDQGGLRYTCTVDDVLTQPKLQLLRLLLKRVNDYVVGTFAVVPVQGALHLRVASEEGDTPECGDSVTGTVPVPDEYLLSAGGAGRPNTDLIVFVTTWPTSAPTRAYASSCAVDQLGRPVAGLININPGRLVDQGGSGNDIDYATVLHELLHIVGFSATAFGTYVDANGAPLDISQVIDQTTLRYGKPVYRARTPRLLAVARKHFECPTLAGVEIDDFDRRGLGFGNHWEARLLGNELMTPTIQERDFALSDLTLAMIESSGWYVVNYQQADPLLYGKATGCSFLEEQCGTWQQPGYQACQHYQDPKSEECSFDNVRFGHCDTIRSAVCLEEYFQVFANDCKVGGARFASDYCPLVSTTHACTNDSIVPRAGRGETFSPTSRCFTAGEGNGVRTARCFQHRCTADELIVVVDGRDIKCPRNGSVIATPLGQLECPPYLSLCCPCVAGKGVCYSGRCSCVRGARGPLCEETIPPWSNVVPSPAGNPIGTDVMGVVPDKPPLVLPASFDALTLGLIVGGSVFFLIIVGVIVGMLLRWRRRKREDAMLSSSSSSSMHFSNSAFGGMQSAVFNNSNNSGAMFDVAPPRAYGQPVDNGAFPGAVLAGDAMFELPQRAYGNSSGVNFGAPMTGADLTSPTLRGRTTVGGDGRGVNGFAPMGAAALSTFQSARDSTPTTLRSNTTVGGARAGTTTVPRRKRNNNVALEPRKRDMYAQVPRAFVADVLWDVVAESKDEISAPKGAVVEVLDATDADWWVVRFGGEIGTCPAAYLRRVGAGASSADLF